MCGSYALYAEDDEITQHFNIVENKVETFQASYNIAPSQTIVVISDFGSDRILRKMRWGLIPAWSKQLPKSILNNARVETIADKPSFRSAFRHRRCLIAANGYYEWHTIGKIKQPYFIHDKSQPLIGLAGIWERWTHDEQDIISCAIVTQAAEGKLSRIHDRMPIVLEPSIYNDWLNADVQDPAHLNKLMAKTINNQLDAYLVSPKMNRVGYNQADCLKLMKST